MIGNKWRLDRSAVYGALLGALQLFARPFLTNQELPANAPRLIGATVGAIIGGAFLFVLVALVRNYFVGRNSN